MTTPCNTACLLVKIGSVKPCAPFLPPTLAWAAGFWRLHRGQPHDAHRGPAPLQLNQGVALHQALQGGLPADVHIARQDREGAADVARKPLQPGVSRGPIVELVVANCLQ